jgi:shikimate 5-dehydrogenase
VIHIIFNPPVTRLLEAAQQRGARILNGKGMLDAQLALAADLVLGSAVE